jgi:hypothetical protein
MLTKDKIYFRIMELMIDKENEVTEYPDEMINAYNWGLAHASMIVSGGQVDAIKAKR